MWRIIFNNTTIVSKSTEFELSKVPVLSAYLLRDLGNPPGICKPQFPI